MIYIKQRGPMQNTLNIDCLIDTLAQIANKACQIIRLSSGKKTQVKQKGFLDPVTQIDHTIQKAAVDLLSDRFKSIKVVGEEHLDEEMIDLDVISKVPQTELKFCFHGQVLTGLKLQEEDICVFIDPLDCTRGYVSGNLWECTVLLGVTHKGTPILGAIGQPFRRAPGTKKSEYFPRIMIGGTIFESPCAYEHSQIGWRKIFANAARKNIEFAVSSRRRNKIQDELTTFMGAQQIHCGGSGNKIAMMVRGELDAVIFVQTEISTWDSCAGEAIVRGMRGQLTKPDSRPIEYLFGVKDQTNREGFICCLNGQLHKEIISFLKTSC